MPATRLRAIGYTRVSSLEQVERGNGLEIQRRAIVQYCKRNRLALVELLSDDGISGSRALDGRVGLVEALSRIERQDATVLVVFRLDRLARDLLLQETVIHRLRQCGGSVVSVSEPDIDGEDPTRVLVRQILGALSQYERTLIKARMAAGRRAKIERGGYIGGIPKYGLRRSPPRVRGESE